MCSWCEVTDSFCFCGTTKDPNGNTTPCGVRMGGTCDQCGHIAGSVPADTDQHGYDYTEYDYAQYE